jgi:hypothetical protein
MDRAERFLVVLRAEPNDIAAASRLRAGLRRLWTVHRIRTECVEALDPRDGDPLQSACFGRQLVGDLRRRRRGGKADRPDGH